MLIERIAGVKAIFTVDDVRDRIKGILDGLLIKWITKVGGDVFNLMANATDIAKGILEDLDMELIKIGLTMTDFRISEFTYPENISKRADQAAEHLGTLSAGADLVIAADCTAFSCAQFHSRYLAGRIA